MKFPPYILPFYHTVSNENLDYIKHLFPIKSSKEFITDLDFICSRFNPVSLEEFYKYAFENFKTIKKPIFHLSFDDGLRQCYDEVMPILESKGIPATFFINSDFINNKNLFFRFKASLIINELSEKQKKTTKKNILQLKYNQNDLLDKIANNYKIDFEEFLKKEKPYLTVSQLNKMVEKGFTLGGHSSDHPEFRLIEKDKMIKQISNSMKFINNITKKTPKAFSFPFTDFQIKHDVFQEIHDLNIVDITFGTAGIKNDEAFMNFQRIPMENSFSPNQTYKFHKMKSVLRSLIGKNTINR